VANRPWVTVAVAAGLALVGVAGCGGSSQPAAAPAAASPSPTGPPPCPTPSTTAAQWPLAVPADLPKPPGARITSTSLQGKATYVQFTTPTSLRESVIFVVNELRAAGYQLGRGDAEPAEADAPFTGPTVVGAMRMVSVQPCRTQWVLAVVPREDGTKPASGLIPYTPGSSASPLPFGP